MLPRAMRDALAAGSRYRRPPLIVGLALGLAGVYRDVDDPWWRRRIWVTPDELDLGTLQAPGQEPSDAEETFIPC